MDDAKSEPAQRGGPAPPVGSARSAESAARCRSHQAPRARRCRGRRRPPRCHSHRNVRYSWILACRRTICSTATLMQRACRAVRPRTRSARSGWAPNPRARPSTSTGRPTRSTQIPGDPDGTLDGGRSRLSSRHSLTDFAGVGTAAAPLFWPLRGRLRGRRGNSR